MPHSPLTTRALPPPYFDGSLVLTVGVLDLDRTSRAAIREALEQGGHLVHEILDPDLDPSVEFDAIIVDRRVWSEPAAVALRTDDVSSVVLVDLDDGLVDLPADADECLARPIRAKELVLRVEGVATRHQLAGNLGAVRALRGEQTRMWSVLIEFSRSVTRLVTFDATVDAIVSAAADLTFSRRVSLMLPDKEGDFLTIARAVGIPDDICSSARIRIGDSVAGRAFKTGESVTSSTCGGIDGWAYEGESFVSMPISTASMSGPTRRVGVLNITNRIGDVPFTEWELEFIEILGRIAGAAIDDTMWRVARDSMLKVERDFEVARQIQQSTFPKVLPSVAGFEFAAWSEPAEQTGGDTFDIIGLRARADGGYEITNHEPERIILLLADATGHGIGPALSVTQFRAMLRIAVRSLERIEDIARLLNRQLFADLPGGRFISAWLAELVPSTSTLRCVNAGAGPVLHVRNGKAAPTHIDSDTVPFGVIEDLPPLVPATIAIARGDRLVAVSDGITDARDAGGAFFDLQRLSDHLAEVRSADAEAILDSILTTLATFAGETPAADDRTVFVVGCR